MERPDATVLWKREVRAFMDALLREDYAEATWRAAIVSALAVVPIDFDSEGTP